MPFKFKPQKRFCFFQLKRFAEKLNTVNNVKKNLNEIMVMKSEKQIREHFMEDIK